MIPAIRRYGKDFGAIAEVIGTKTPAQVSIPVPVLQRSAVMCNSTIPHFSLPLFWNQVHFFGASYLSRLTNLSPFRWVRSSSVTDAGSTWMRCWGSGRPSRWPPTGTRETPGGAGRTSLQLPTALQRTMRWGLRGRTWRYRHLYCAASSWTLVKREKAFVRDYFWQQNIFSILTLQQHLSCRIVEVFVFNKRKLLPCKGVWVNYYWLSPSIDNYLNRW